MSLMMMMMESPVGTTYELRSHSLLPVGPRMTDKADSCGQLSTAVITDKASCICGLGCGDGLTWITQHYTFTIWHECLYTYLQQMVLWPLKLVL